MIKKMKGLYIILVIAFIVASTTVFATAEKKISKNDITSLIENNLKVLDTKTLDESLNNSKKQIVKLLTNGNVNEDILNSIDFRSSNGIKKYGTKVSDIYEKYMLTNNFSDIITDEYCYEVPLVDKAKNNDVITVATYFLGKPVEELKKESIPFPSKEEEARFWEQAKQNENKWYLVQVYNTILPKHFKLIQQPNNVVSMLKKEGITSVTNFKYVSLGEYRTNILYFKSGEKEYAVPFGLREDITGVENMKVYSIQDLLKKLHDVFENTSF